jgi:signal transduction histidine kinase
LLDKNILSFIPKSQHETEIEKIKYITENNSTLPFIEEQYLKKDKSVIYVESAMLSFNREGKIFIQLVFRDITERKRSEAELKKAYAELKKTQQALIQNEKLAALGRFSAGIAHEIRNPLANISASAQFCMTKYEIDEKMKRHFDVILRNTETANRIIKELLDFTSPRETLLIPGNVKDVLYRVCEMAKSRCAKQNIGTEVLVPDDLPDIRMNEKKLEEAFMNFVSNAIEAMPEGGKLTVQASIIDDDSISISFKDTGCGINHDHIDKIFEPFFTTKDDGTGLGLSLAYHIINAHSGNLSIESKDKKGTKIDIILPIIKILEVI